MKYSILINIDYFHNGFSELDKRYNVSFPVDGKPLSYKEVSSIIHLYDAFCCMYNFQVDENLIKKASKLKVIANYASGVDNINVNYALKKGICITHVPNTGVESTANLALSLLLAVANKMTYLDRNIRTRKSISNSDSLGANVINQKLGILGLGRIGKALCKRAQICGMDVVYNNRRQLPLEDEMRMGVKYVSFEELISTSDFLSIHVPLYEETFQLIDESVINRMKNSAILINTSRGQIIDEYALAKALENGIILGAGLDTFIGDKQPIKELCCLKNVILTPHIGAQTSQIRVEMAKSVCDNIIGYFENDRNYFQIK